ncbi:MAG: metallophosphoesterase [Deltaproteobacteria bacterium]|nr:metallophosphoesterase [Deltaproteobacteria bacterium]
MKLLVTSDLHVEFHADGGRGLLDSLDTSGIDVLVVAGDLATGGLVGEALRALCVRFRQVVYVLGNHEYYHSSPEEVDERMRVLAERLQNLHWLDCSTAEIDGVRFAGATLWFEADPENRRWAHMMSDFSAIAGFVPWVYEQNRRAEGFLAVQAPRSDVVVTHHMPSNRSVAPPFVGNPLNRFFVADVEETVRRSGAALWVHGHTHVRCDYVCGKTRVLCNPHGYPDEATTPLDPRRVVVDVQPRIRARPGSRKRRA